MRVLKLSKVSGEDGGVWGGVPVDNSSGLAEELQMEHAFSCTSKCFNGSLSMRLILVWLHLRYLGFFQNKRTKRTSKSNPITPQPQGSPNQDSPNAHFSEPICPSTQDVCEVISGDAAMQTRKRFPYMALNNTNSFLDHFYIFF